MRVLLTLLPLFIAAVLIQLSMGGVGPLDALSGLSLGFSASDIGLLGSAHFFGFFIGCWWAPRLMARVGHSRAFASFAAMGVIGLLAHMLWPDAWFWALLRIASGMSVAGCYTVIEAWLQARLTNADRGQGTAAYRVVDLVAQLGAQLIVSVLDPASYTAYVLLAMLTATALLPLTLTNAAAPTMPTTTKMAPMLAYAMSPLAVIAVLTAALGSASFRMVGPVVASVEGLDARQTGFYLAAFVGGGALSQFPVGWLADRFDRRLVLLILSGLAIVSSATSVMALGQGVNTLLWAAAFFGAATFPIYSVACAHAHDFATSDQRVALTAALMFWFALGAIAAPLLGSWLLTHYGAAGLFGIIAAAHGALLAFGGVRMLARPTPAERTRYRYAPRTSFQVGNVTSDTRDDKK